MDASRVERFGTARNGVLDSIATGPSERPSMAARPHPAPDATPPEETRSGAITTPRRSALHHLAGRQQSLQQLMTANNDSTTDPDLETGDRLYDRASGEEYALVVDVDDTGVTVRQGDTEYYVPHALFTPWNDSGLVLDRVGGRDRREWSEIDTYERVC